MKPFALLALLFVVGCADYSPAPPDPVYHTNKRLTIVAPSAWEYELASYIHDKKADGFQVTLLRDETNQIQLVGDIFYTHPDYVFLVGDTSLIPTAFKCTVDDTYVLFPKTCLYSDSWLTDAVVGRLMTHNIADVRSYVLKAAIYRDRAHTHRAYLVNDRAYDDDDGTVGNLASYLEAQGFTTKVDALNLQYNSFVTDGAGEATLATLSSAVDQDVDLISYYGHGAALGWGYHLNLPYAWLSFHDGSVVPLVFAMACETARDTPQPPWYPYYDVNGNYVNFGALIADGATTIPVEQITDPNPLQPTGVLNGSIGERFVGDQAAGAMVYIGETVVTSAERAVLNRFYENVVNAYSQPTTIGDIWGSAVGLNGHPEFWQLVGDPSTWYR